MLSAHKYSDLQSQSPIDIGKNVAELAPEAEFQGKVARVDTVLPEANDSEIKSSRLDREDDDASEEFGAFIKKSKKLLNAAERTPENKQYWDRVDDAEERLTNMGETVKAIQKELLEKLEKVGKVEKFFGKIGLSEAYKEVEAVENYLSEAKLKYKSIQEEIRDMAKEYEARLNFRDPEAEKKVQKTILGKESREDEKSDSSESIFVVDDTKSVETIFNRQPKGNLVSRNIQKQKASLDNASDQIKNDNDARDPFLKNENPATFDAQEKAQKRRGVMLNMLQEVSFGDRAVWGEIRGMTFSELEDRRPDLYVFVQDALRKYQDYVGIDTSKLSSSQKVEERAIQIMSLYFKRKGW